MGFVDLQSDKCRVFIQRATTMFQSWNEVNLCSSLLPNKLLVLIPTFSTMPTSNHG